MPLDHCDFCNQEYPWSWTEAFYKFGFNGGDGFVQTGEVKDVLVDAGYKVETIEWGLHNTVINSIKRDDVEQIPPESPTMIFGYEDPRDYLPDEIVRLLDSELPDPEVLL